jgi:hypothetical protein
MRLFFLACPRLHYVKAGSAIRSYGLKKRHEGCRFYPSRKTRQYYHYSKRSNHTSTETKAEQLDDYYRHAAHTASRNDNERLLYYWSKPLQQYLIHTIKTNGSFLLFFT